MAEELDYVPMPKKVVDEIEKACGPSEIKDASGKPLHTRRYGALSSMQSRRGPHGRDCTVPRSLILTGPSRELSCAAAGVSFEWALPDVVKEAPRWTRPGGDPWLT